MAETVQARLPAEMAPIIKEIKVYREKKLEPTSTKSIIIDALKMMRSNLKSNDETNTGVIDG